MPEGDTVHLAATRLQRALSGRVLRKSDFRVPQIAAVDLTGRRVEEVVARGKHMLLRIEGGTTLHTHFEMDGEWHVYRRGQRWRERPWEARVVLETDDWTAVGFRLAITELVRTEREHEIVGHLGPDPLGHDWDPDEALRRIEKDRARPIATVLLDQEVIAGLGNVYKSEICFLRGVNPWTPVGEIAELAGLVDLARRVMEANRNTGKQITTGYDVAGRRHWVYGRAGQPCRRCGTPIAKTTGRAERDTYWCPTCQPPPSPQTRT